MNCVELQRSLAEREDGRSAEQQAHLRSCPACSALVADLTLITAAAAKLSAAEDPSPRVWNSLEIALRQEGLIRPPRAGLSLLPSLGTRWGWARWLAPAAAAVLIVVGVYVRQQSSPRQVALEIPPQPVSYAAVAGLNDEDLLQEIADQSPVIQAEYKDNLRRVNEYIRDAEVDVQANPYDAEARRSVVEAYQQKAMLFEMAMDRALP
jgi:hypothetical protein